MNRMRVGDAFTGVAGPLGLPSELHHYGPDETVVFTASRWPRVAARPPDRPRTPATGNHVTLISGFRTASLQFWTGEEDRLAQLKAEFGNQLEVVLTTDDGSFGIKGFVTTPLEACWRPTSVARAAALPRWSRSVRRS